MKHKIIISVVIVVLGLIVLGLLFTGSKRGDVMLTDYTVSEDGSAMTIRVGVASSMGYVRSLKVKQGGDNLYLTFYSTLGLNSKLGAKDEFNIDIGPYCTEIYFYHGDGGYKLVLEKNTENEWNRVR